MQIYVGTPLGEPERALLEQEVDGAELTFMQDLAEREQKARFQKAEVAFGNVAPAWVEGNKRLRWLQLESAGFDPYRHLGDEEQLTITHLKGFFGEPVAETALAGILALYRGLDRLAVLREEHRWEKLSVRPRLQTLRGRTAVVLGSGAIGGALRELLEAFACCVITMAKSDPAADIYTSDALDKALPEADIVACCLPETDETRGLFGAERLALMRETALFVNVGRGSVADEAALVKALEEDRLGGCALDATREEPLPEDHPLWRTPRTILTQHTGGGTTDELTRKVRVFLGNLERYRASRPLENVVDFERGY